MDHVLTLMDLHETNQIINYSNTLSGQIPKSRAAIAFNEFKTAMHLFELTRLYALWDSYGNDRDSIWTVIALIDKPEIINMVAGKKYDKTAVEHIPYYKTDDPEFDKSLNEYWQQERVERATEYAQADRTRLIKAIERARSPHVTDLWEALRDARNQYIAHNLQKPAPANSLKYGDEKKLLNEAITIIDSFYLALHDKGFDWDGSHEISRERASELWNNCEFNIKGIDDVDDDDS